METFEFLMTAVAVACLLGPVTGAAAFVAFRAFARLSQRGFSLHVVMPPPEKERPYERD